MAQVRDEDLKKASQLPFPSGAMLRAFVLAMVLVAGCGPRPAPTGINDPLEAQNREIHAFNKAVDSAILKPLSGGKSGPTPLKTGISNAARNLNAPGEVVNGILQLRPHHALENTLRFALNTTVGLGGLFDPATALGINGKPTDFGETLHVWGVGEGNYVELPFIGPSTERDMVGKIVDTAINPLGHLLPRREANAATAVRLAGKITDRSSYSETVDSILYESEDSYAQARLIYLQNRRYVLGQSGGTTADDDFIDPYEDPYGY